MRRRIGRRQRAGRVTLLATGRRFEWVLVLLIVISDQLTKALVRRALDLHESITVIPDLLTDEEIDALT